MRAGLTLVIAAAAGSAFGCDRGARTSAGDASSSSSTCPSAPLIQELHAAAFFYEHGSADTARQHLQQARELAAHDHLDATATTVLAALVRVDAEIAQNPATAKNEVEQTRAAFADWPCLPDAMHRGFHSALPPVR